MSLKTCPLFSNIGTTGTTAIAIPSSYDYGNGLVNSDPKLKDIKVRHEKLDKENIELQRGR